MLKESNEIHDKLVENVNYFRDKMLAAGFDIKPTQSAICAVMLYDAPLSQRYANRLLEEGIYVTGFYYPVVPKGEAPHPRPALGRSHQGAARPRHRCFHQGRQGTWRAEVNSSTDGGRCQQRGQASPPLPRLCALGPQAGLLYIVLYS